jgi:tetraacyldisaccharide 4'-kinase
MVRLLSALYSLGIRVRNSLYDLGIFRSHHTPPVVISVGNIEVGGTGKTPFTLAMARRLKEQGHHVAILTRGYKGRMAGTLLVHPESRYEDVGDEALLMARTAGVPVIK